jgi:Tfp pilus assembly protein PilV
MVAVKNSYINSDACPRGTRRRVPARDAFTIVEVMVSAVVMALAISTSIVAMQRAFLALDSARNTTLAGQILQSEIEKSRLNDWSTVSGYPAGPTKLAIPTAFTGNSTISNRFSMTRSVAAHPSIADIKVITLAIAWNTYDGRPQSRFYTTYYGRNGLYDFFYNSF